MPSWRTVFLTVTAGMLRPAVLIRDGRIVGVGALGEVPPDWPQTRLPAGAVLAPGFIDLQVNGGGGVLLNDQPTADGMRAIARAHRRYGTTACLPTLITDTREQMRTAIAAAARSAAETGFSACTWKGPFISPRRPGVHRPDRIAQPGAGDLEQLCELAGAGTVIGDTGARMRSGWLCPDIGLLGCADFDRA